MEALNDYERHQLAQLRRWQAQPPDLGSRLLSVPTGMAGKVVQAVVPVSVLQGALNAAGSVALRLSEQRSLLERAGVSSLEQLRARPLRDCDQLATRETRIAMTLGGISGSVFGIAGAAGMAVDIPTLIMGVLRTVHRLGLCYGEDAPRALLIGVFALASAGTMDEKRDALNGLREEVADPSGKVLRDGLERAAERELAKEAAMFSLQTLAQRVGTQLTRRKAAEALPVFGAAVGGVVNAWYVRDVARVARHVFQERWLHARHPQLRI